MPSIPFRAKNMDFLDWHRVLFTGGVIPLTSQSVMTVAAARLITVRAGEIAYTHPGITSDAIDDQLAVETLLSPRAVRDVRLGRRRLNSAEADTLFTRSNHRDWFLKLVVEALRSWAELLRKAPETVRRTLEAGQSVQTLSVSNIPLPQALDEEERQFVAARVAADVSALATGAWASEPPRAQEPINWRLIAAQITGDTTRVISTPSVPSTRSMVRSVVTPGETVRNDVITDRVQATYGRYAPSRRTISDAITGLRRTGELRNIRYGVQEVSHALRR